MSQIIRFPTVYNPVTGLLYAYDVFEEGDVPAYDRPLMDVTAFNQLLGGDSKAASTVSLDQIFYNNGKEEYNFLDYANTYYDKIAQARSAGTRQEQISKAAAVITSRDFTDFQNTVIIGQNQQVPTRTGILTGLFEEVQLPQLSGKWAAFADDLKYHRNLPETKSPEPSGGSGSLTTVSVQKHGGAVAITRRAEAVINGDNPFQRLVAQMQLLKAKDENAMVAAEIESNVANTITGVDFGLRSGTPPASSTNPVDFLTSLQNTFEALSQQVNLFITKGFVYYEYLFNDIVRGGVNNLPPSVGAIDEQISPFPGIAGVRWARDNAISSSTAGWALFDGAIKNFRSFSLNYTIQDSDIETTKYVTKNHFKPDTMDATLVYTVTGVAAA